MGPRSQRRGKCYDRARMRILCLLAPLAFAAPAAPKPPETVTVRVAAADAGAVVETAAAAKDKVDALVFPEGFGGGVCPDDALRASIKEAAGPDMLVALGSARCGGPDGTFGRAWVLSSGGWIAFDKLDPTPAERAAKPPVKSGTRLILFRFRGGLAAVLPAYSVQKPELAGALKKRGVSLLLATAAVEDEDGRRRLARTASARAVELGAAVVVAPAAGAPSLYLPAQKGFDEAPALTGRDAAVPWRRLLELRAPRAGATEPRPFLDQAHYYQVEY